MKLSPVVVPQCPRRRGFDVFELERGFEQRIVLQIDLSDREVICGAPVGVHFFQQIGRQRSGNQGNLYGLVSRVGSRLLRRGLLRRSVFDHFHTDKIRATISRGCGSIETVMDFSSSPGSSSASNWLCSKLRGMKCSCRVAIRRAISVSSPLR